ncbi:acyltransferase family protein [Aestuariivirga sp.]|uniref:acyltransferase family protein n=1 Tax=Aestuariivirga sp. TaxID=2650926 RepID=UPI0039E6EEE4
MTIAYRPEIDGLRAVAVVSVILFHAGAPFFSGGYVGVDVFFVISGYLITSIILAEFQDGSFSFARFYERRARRILPALYLVMAVSLPAGLLLLYPTDLKSFLSSLGSIAVFSSNVQFWSESGYFDVDVDLKPMLHTWSLAVEEQYYFLFPIFLAAMVRWRHWPLAWVFLIVGAASLLLSQWLSVAAPSANFFLLPTRFWELAVGSGLALDGAKRLSQALSKPARDGLALTGLFAIAAAIVLFDDLTPVPSLYALLPTLGTAAVILAATPESVTGRVLAWRPLVAIGLVSYSAYLWHQPVFAFTRYWSLAEPSPFVKTGLVLASFALAYLSWRFVERNFRFGSLFSRQAVLRMALAGVFIFVGLATAGRLTNGFADRLDPRERQIVDNFHSPMRDDGACRIYADALTPVVVSRFEECAARFGPALVVLGDSHAMNLFNAVTETSKRPFILGLSRGGCRPHTPLPECHYDAFLGFIAGHEAQVSSVIFNQAGFYLLRNEKGGQGTREMFKTSNLPVFAPHDENIAKVRDYLKSVAKHAKVTWLGPWAEPHLNARALLRLAIACEQVPPPIPATSGETFARLDRAIATLLQGDPDIAYVSAVKLMNIDWSHDLYDCDGTFWADADHMSPFGERRFGPRLWVGLAAPAGG